MPKNNPKRRLWNEKKRLERLIPLVSPSRSTKMVQRLQRINTKLGIREEGFDADVFTTSQQALAASGINGVGGLRFLTETPPGPGRLVRIPFYLESFDATQASSPVVDGTVFPLVVTAGGQDVGSSTNPVVIATVPTQVGVRAVHSMLFRTPVIEWATYRLVGFQSRGLIAPVATAGVAPPAPGADYPLNNAVYTNAPVPFLLVRDLQVEGSANLFCQGGYQDAAYYNGGLPYMTGLRAYPTVNNTNRAQVSAAVVGAQGSAMSFTLNLVGEIQTDADLGEVPAAPYVARDSLSRIRLAGQSFVRD